MQITFNTNVFTGPLLSGNSFNDTDDEATFSTTAGGTFVWATHLTTETLTANGSGGWTGSLLESGTDTVATSGETTITATYTATTGTGGESRKFSYYVRDAAGNDSNVITEAFTVNSTGYTANAVDTQGSAYLSNASYSGPAAGKTGTMSLWFNMQGTWDSPASQILLRLYNSGGVDRFSLTTSSSGRLNFNAKNSAGTVILQRVNNSSSFVVNTWYHLLVSWDLASSTVDYYLDDALVASFAVSTTTNDNIDALGRLYVGANSIGTANADTFFAELWMDTTYRDLSVTATRRNFIDASGKPADLTGYGSPHLWLKGDYTAFGTNSGSGGNLTVNGTFVAATSSPSD